MSANTSIKSNVLSTEAPASWNTRYQTPEGFVCQITLRGDTGKDLLEKANAAITWLQENGFQPGESLQFPSPQQRSATSCQWQSCRSCPMPDPQHPDEEVGEGWQGLVQPQDRCMVGAPARPSNQMIIIHSRAVWLRLGCPFLFLEETCQKIQLHPFVSHVSSAIKRNVHTYIPVLAVVITSMPVKSGMTSLKCVMTVV